MRSLVCRTKTANRVPSGKPNIFKAMCPPLTSDVVGLIVQCIKCQKYKARGIDCIPSSYFSFASSLLGCHFSYACYVSYIFAAI